MKELFDKKLLDPAVFLRVHKSYIVNTRYARRYLKEEGGKIILNHSDIEIPVSNSYRNEVMARIHAMN
jgi:DNA-binding LytR/AlgR family response regulator